MPHKIEAKCPKCQKIAKNYDEIEDKFGWRILRDKKTPQSYCRNCRKNK